MNNNRSFWTLPGPESFCERILENLAEGKNVILFLPEYMPGGLKEFVESATVKEIPDKCFYELFQSEFKSDFSPLANLFKLFNVELEEDLRYNVFSHEFLVKNDSFRNNILWIEATDELNLQDWLAFLQTYEKTSRNTDLSERSLFCFCIFGRSFESVEIREDVCLKFLQWEECVDFFDMLLYAHWNFSTSSERALYRELAVNVAACLALWDPKVVESLAEFDFRDVLSPHRILKKIGCERGWANKGFRPCWENGAKEKRGKHFMLHSSFLALDGEKIKELDLRIWRAQNMFLLPLIEEQRLKIVESLKGKWEIPFSSYNGYFIKHAEDLEIGHIWFQIEKGYVQVLDSKKQLVKRLRDLRNILAHHQIAKEKDFDFLI